MAIVVGASGVAFGTDAQVRRSEPTCLSISPFRAVPALSGRPDSLGPEGWRDEVVGALRHFRSDSSWIFRKGGDCPESIATIDIFQYPTDVVASAQGQALRLRLEWRHVAGQTEFFVAGGSRNPLDASAIAAQILAVADQMMARVELSSTPPGALVRVGSGANSRPVGECPQLLLVPPGALSLAFSFQNKLRRVDTLVGAGKDYQVLADFQSARIDPRVRWEPRPTWPLWTLALVSLAGGVWAVREQVIAQRAYSRLGSGDAPATFSTRWSDLRSANLWRNGFISATVGFGLGASWLEWSNGRTR